MKRYLLLLTVLVLFFIVHTPASAQVTTSDKLITVDTGKQMLYAWNHGRIEFQTLVSTGMYYTPTVKGTFKIYSKYELQDMKGHYLPYEPYSIKNVPNVMYFYQAYAIHGAYWHNHFGSKYTHGCVNVPVAASVWLFSFADVGTQVMVF